MACLGRGYPKRVSRSQSSPIRSVSPLAVALLVTLFCVVLTSTASARGVGISREGSPFRPSTMTFMTVPAARDIGTFVWYVDGERYGAAGAKSISVTREDGKTHQIRLEITLTANGNVNVSETTWTAPRPMRFRVPAQSAASARSRGIRVNVSGPAGYYRGSVENKGLYAAGGGRVTDTKLTFRLTGKGQRKFRPGQRVTVLVKRVIRDEVLGARRIRVTLR